MNVSLMSTDELKDYLESIDDAFRAYPEGVPSTPEYTILRRRRVMIRAELDRRDKGLFRCE